MKCQSKKTCINVIKIWNLKYKTEDLNNQTCILFFISNNAEKDVERREEHPSRELTSSELETKGKMKYCL